MAGTELQVLVVGGGVVGAGVALDAATRGLSVGLVEARDFASGTSSRSSKLIHGGLRYLEQFNFGLVREALTERALLMQRIAPHLIRPVSFLFPFSHYGWERAYVGTGVTMYDVLGVAPRPGQGPAAAPAADQAARAAAGARAAQVGADRRACCTGTPRWTTPGTCVDLIRTASGYGAQVASRTQVTGFLREGERVTGVRAVDLETGSELQIRAQQVVNATGVWTDEIQAMVGGRGSINVRASKGVHLVVPRDRIQSSTGIILRTPSSVLFVIPWGRHWIIGTTDTDWALSKAHPAASRADIDYVLDQVNRVLAVPLTRDDVEGVYAGLRPLLAGESDPTSKLSTRAHRGAPGARPGDDRRRQVHHLPADGEGRRGRGRARPGRQGRAVLHGPDPAGRAPTASRRCGTPGTRSPGPPACTWRRIEHLLHRYGALIGELLEMIAADPSLGRPLAGAEDYLRVEAVYAVTHEGARHLDDVLARRTHISIETWDRGLSAAEEVAALMAGPMKWRHRQVTRESSTTGPASRPSASRRRPTPIPTRTRSGSAHRKSCPWWCTARLARAPTAARPAPGAAAGAAGTAGEAAGQGDRDGASGASREPG